MKRLSLAFIVSLGLLQMGCGAPTHFSVFVKEPSSVRVTIVDKRPDEQKSYRGPEALGEAKHIFGDSNFVPPLFEIVSADIQSSYSRVHTNEVLEISGTAFYSRPQFFRARFKTFCASVRALVAPSDKTWLT